MQTKTPAENLLQRLLQSDKIRETYTMLLEEEDGCTKISLRCSIDANEKKVSTYERLIPLLSKNFFNGNERFSWMI